jgi:glutaredoxin
LTPITLYGASWCPACRKTQGFLRSQGMAFRDVDVDQPSGQAEMRLVSTQRSIPVVLVDGTVINGYSPEGIMTAAKRSVERRLGISGLRLEVR